MNHFLQSCVTGSTRGVLREGTCIEFCGVDFYIFFFLKYGDNLVTFTFVFVLVLVPGTGYRVLLPFPSTFYLLPFTFYLLPFTLQLQVTVHSSVAVTVTVT